MHGDDRAEEIMKRLTLWLATFVAASAFGSTIYDSKGFETPTFMGSSAGTNIQGQNGWSSFAVGITSGHVLNAPVGGVSPVGGSQFVRIRASDDSSVRYNYIDVRDAVNGAIGNAATRTIVMRTMFCLGVTSTVGWSGILAYANNGSDRVGGIYANSSGELVFIGHKDQDQVTLPGFQEGAWYQLEMSLNYATSRLSARVNGQSIGSFALKGVVQDFDFYSQSASAGQINGYFDDYAITAVPEPATLLMMATGAAVLARKRSKV